MFQKITLLVALMAIAFGVGYGVGRRMGRREGLKEGLLRAPLEIRRRSLLEGRCIICTPKESNNSEE